MPIRFPLVVSAVFLALGLLFVTAVLLTRSYQQTRADLRRRIGRFGIANNRIFTDNGSLRVPYVVGDTLLLHAFSGDMTQVLSVRRFPDGTILVKLAWKHVPVEGLEGAFVTGSATTVQVMVKDTKRYASTGGWGFGRFIDGMPVDEMQHRTCVPCHEAHVKDHDLVFTRFAR